MRPGPWFPDKPALWALGAAALLLAGRADAGVFAAPSVRWSSFALRPLADEATPNYYGLGASGTFGYSFAQTFDVGGFYTYVPGHLKPSRLTGRDATLDDYGGDVAIRIADSVALDLRGGRARYRLVGTPGPDAVAGSWSGPAGAVGLGAVARLGKQSFFQTSIELLHTVLEKNGDAAAGKRRLDAFALSFAFVFNAAQKFKFEDTIFRDFVDGLTFF